MGRETGAAGSHQLRLRRRLPRASGVPSEKGSMRASAPDWEGQLTSKSKSAASMPGTESAKPR